MSCKCAVCRAMEMTERDPRLRITSLDHRMTWVMLVRAFDVHGTGRVRYLAASRDLSELSKLVDLPVEDLRSALRHFEDVGLLRRNGSGEVFICNIFMSMANLAGNGGEIANSSRSGRRWWHEQASRLPDRGGGRN